MNNANMQGDGTEHRLERFSRIQKDALVLLLLCKEKGTAIVPFTRLLGFINSVPDSQDVAEPNLRKSLKTLQQNGYAFSISYVFRGQIDNGIVRWLFTK